MLNNGVILNVAYNIMRIIIASFAKPSRHRIMAS